VHAQMLHLDPGYAARSGPLTRAAGVRSGRDRCPPTPAPPARA